MDIYLKQAILHIVDREAGDPVYSQVTLDLTTEYIRTYLSNKLKKLANAQTKTGTLVAESALAQLLPEAQENFVGFSEQFVARWYDVYRESEEAPSADVFMVLYEQDAQMYVGFLKVNYTDGYTHLVEPTDEGLMNKLIINRAILANKTQKADEGLTINLTDLRYELMEKKYPFSGEKKAYLSTKVIEAEPAPSLEENVKVIKKVAEKIGQKFDTPAFDIVADVKEAVVETIENNGQIIAKDVAEKVFKDNITAQLAFQDEVKEKGFVDEAPLLRDAKEISEKKFAKQKLKLSNGIELIVPIDIYRDPEVIEFVNQPDGTLSVMIKNIDDVINRL